MSLRVDLPTLATARCTAPATGKLLAKFPYALTRNQTRRFRVHIVKCEACRQRLLFRSWFIQSAKEWGEDFLVEDLLTQAVNFMNAGKHTQADRLLQELLEIRPDHRDALFNLGVCRMILGNLKDAEQILSDVVKRHPEHCYALSTLGHLKLTMGSFEEAETLLRQSIDLYSKDARAYWSLAQVRMERGHPDDAVSLLESTAVLDPTLPQLGESLTIAHLRCAVKFRQEGRIEDAENAYRNAAQRCPELENDAPRNPSLRYHLGVYRCASGHIVAAVMLWRKVLKAEPYRTGVISDLAAALVQSGQAAKALRLVQKARSRYPQDMNVRISEARVSMALGQRKRAFGLYRNILRTDPGHPFVRSEIANAYMGSAGSLAAAGRIRAAIRAASKALEYDPDNMMARLDVTTFYLRLRDPEEAFKHLCVLEAAGFRHPAFYHNLGQYWEWKGDLERAHTQYFRALEMDGEYVPSLFNVGRIHLLHRETDQALHYFSGAQSIFVDSPDIHVAVSACYIELAEYQRALDHLNKANVLRPGHWATLNHIGVCNLYLHKYAKAAEYFLASVQAAPTRSEARFNLGNAYYALGRYEQAAAVYQEASRLNPSSSATHNNLALALQALGRFREAIRAFERALRLYPHDSGTLCNLGVCRHLSGDSRDALRILKQAHEVDESNDGIKRNLERVRRESESELRVGFHAEYFQHLRETPMLAKIEPMAA